MRQLLLYSLLFLSSGITGWAQHIEAINEDSTRHVWFRLNQGVECELLVANQPVTVRGRLALIDSTSFRLELGDGYYTTVYLDNVIRLRRRHYTRQRLATAGLGSSLLGGGIVGGTSPGSAVLVATSALAGLGIALARERTSFHRKDPSIYQGWLFQAHPN